MGVSAMRRNQPRLSSVLERVLSLVIVLGLCGALVVWWRRMPHDPVKIRLSSVPRDGTDTLVLVFLSRTCRACNQQPGADSLVHSLQRLARLQGRPRLVGIAIDADVHAGARYLEQIAAFDEVSTGSGWSNDLALRYLFPDGAPIIANVPQLVLVERHLSFTEGTPAVTSMSSAVIGRVLGLGPITHWIHQTANGIE